jgi:hypothetical protein
VTETTKTIWLPVSETKVTVKDGDVTVVDEMTMRPRPIGRPQPGFGEKP